MLAQCIFSIIENNLSCMFFQPLTVWLVHVPNFYTNVPKSHYFPITSTTVFMSFIYMKWDNRRTCITMTKPALSYSVKCCLEH